MTRCRSGEAWAGMVERTDCGTVYAWNRSRKPCGDSWGQFHRTMDDKKKVILDANSLYGRPI